MADSDENTQQENAEHSENQHDTADNAQNSHKEGAGYQQEHVAGGAKTSTGLDENLAGLLCYALGWLTGLIFVLVEKDNSFVKFHAIQSLATFLVLQIAIMIPFVGWVLSPFIAIAGFILWILLMYKAYQGERFKLPLVGDFAEKHSAIQQ